MKIGCRDDIRFFYIFVLIFRVIILLLHYGTACSCFFPYLAIG